MLTLQVLQFIPVDKSTWWRGVKDGRFPAAIKLGALKT
jgi:predicted DNA-binding transcriptional regulator AlpA